MEVYQETLTKIFNGFSYWALPKFLVLTIGIYSTLYLSHLVSKLNYLKKNKLIDKNGFFYCTQENIEKDTGMSKRTQQRIIKRLKFLNLIEVKTCTVPPRNYYKINVQELVQRSQNGCYESDKKTAINQPKRLLIYNNNKLEEHKLEDNISKDILESNSKNLNPIKTFNIPKSIKEFFSYWEDNSLPKNRRSSKTFKSNIKCLNQLIEGSLFNMVFSKYKNHKFSLNDWKRSVDNYLIALKSPFHKPYNKTPISNKSINYFLLNKFASNDFSKSLFINYLEHEPQEIENTITDKFPELTKELINVYKKHCIAVNEQNLSFSDKQNFIKASVLLNEFIIRNLKNIDPVFIQTIKEKAELLGNALFDSFINDGIILPGHFCSKFTMEKIFPNYLLKQNIFRESEVCVGVDLSKPIARE